VVRDGDAPAAEEIASLHRSPGERPFVAVQQQTVVLTVAGTRTADTTGQLRVLLAMSTAEGGPGELVLDLSGVVAVDEDRPAPVLEAEKLLVLRTASRRVRSVSAAATRHLDDVHVNRALAAGSPPGVAVPDRAGGTATSALDDRPGREQD
jgi:hypothetical protein